ncbi:MAG: DUF4230 domain-containing protein [Myxococcaceae bacterium]
METPSPASIVPPGHTGPSRRVFALVVLGTLLLLGALLLALFRRTLESPTPDVRTVVERMREVARLETLDVNVYKKVGYAPEPVATGNVWEDVFLWAKSALLPSRGRAIVFGVVHVGLDLSALDVHALALHDGTLEVVLPPLQTRAEVRPAETEVIQSNLDSSQTAQLLELARAAFEQEARADAALQARARASAERALRGLLLSLGFQKVVFVPALSGTG